MSSPAVQRTLIDEIDERQNHLLDEIDALNARVEALLNQCLATRGADADTGILLTPSVMDKSSTSPACSAD